MQQLNSGKFLAAAALVAAALCGANAAHARSDVVFSVGINVPAPVYAHPAPVYVPAPQPVYVQPAPVYVRPAPVYVAPRVVYGPPVYTGGYARAGDHGDWRRHQWERRHGHGHDHRGNRHH